MTRLAKWWRSIGGLAAACLLALFAVGPVADAVVCQADAPAVEAAYAPDKADVAAPGDPKSHPAEAGICVHGHCHHAGPLLAELKARATLPIVSRAAALRGDACFEWECRATDTWSLLHDAPGLRAAGREYTQRFVVV